MAHNHAAQLNGNHNHAGQTGEMQKDLHSEWAEESEPTTKICWQ